MVNEISFSARMPTMQSDHDERHLVLECPAMQVAVRAGSVHCIVQSCKKHHAAVHIRWFARPAGLRQPGPLVMQPLSARCMRIRTLLRAICTYTAARALQDGGPLLSFCVGAGTPGSLRPSACASGATCVLFMMRGTWSWSALPCSALQKNHAAVHVAAKHCGGGSLHHEYFECYKSSRGRSLLHRPLTEPTDSSVESLYPGDTAAFDTLAAPTMCKIRNVMPPVMGAKAW